MRRRAVVATGRHEVVQDEGVDQFHRFVEWWRRARRTRRAPPPIEDDVDLLVYALLTLLFVVAGG